MLTTKISKTVIMENSVAATRINHYQTVWKPSTRIP